MAKILENTLDKGNVLSEGNRYSVTHRMGLGSPLGLRVRSTLFSSLPLASLLSVVGHHHGRERVYLGVDIVLVKAGDRRADVPSNSPTESITDAYEKEWREEGRRVFEGIVVAPCLLMHFCLIISRFLDERHDAH